MPNLRERYFETFTQNCLDAVELTKRKNAGYTGGSDDPFSNFRFAAKMATLPGQEDVSVAQTILSRMADKISRFKSLTLRPDFATIDESMLDTLRDLFVYANILLTWEQLGRPEPGESIVPALDLDTGVITDLATPETGLIAEAKKSLKEMFGWGQKETTNT